MSLNLLDMISGIFPGASTRNQETAEIDTNAVPEGNTAIGVSAEPEREKRNVGYKPKVRYKTIKVPNPDNPNYAKYIRVPVEAGEGEHMVYGGAETGYSPLRVQGGELTPDQEINQKANQYIQDNPKATRREVNDYVNNLQKDLSYSKKVQRKEKYGTKTLESLDQLNKAMGRNIKPSEILEEAEALSIINPPEAQEASEMSFIDLRELKASEEDEIERLIREGYSRSDAIKIIANEFKLKDRLGSLKLRDFGSGKNLKRLFGIGI